MKYMALFFLVITYDSVSFSLKFTALFFFFFFFFDIHIVFNFNFQKDNESCKSVIKGKQLHTLSSLQIHLILDEFDFGPNWTIRFIFPCP